MGWFSLGVALKVSKYVVGWITGGSLGTGMLLGYGFGVGVLDILNCIVYLLYIFCIRA